MPSYQQSKQIRNTDKLFSYLEQLPPFYREMMLSLPEEKMSLSTRTAYARDVLRFFEYLQEHNYFPDNRSITQLATSDLSEFSSDDAQTYADYLSDIVSSNTMNRYLAACSSMYMELMRSGKLTANPFLLVKRPQKEESEAECLDDIEYKIFMDTVATGSGLTEKEKSYHFPVRDLALLSLILDTGLRVSEAVGLDLFDLDLDEHCVLVSRSGGTHDTLYFSDDTQRKLEDYMEHRNIRYDASDDALFLNKMNGERVSVRSIELLVKKYARIAVPKKASHFNVHMLRSSFAVAYYNATHDLVTLQEKMGHKNISTTRLYTISARNSAKESRNFRISE